MSLVSSQSQNQIQNRPKAKQNPKERKAVDCQYLAICKSPNGDTKCGGLGILEVLDDFGGFGTRHASLLALIGDAVRRFPHVIPAFGTTGKLEMFSGDTLHRHYRYSLCTAMQYLQQKDQIVAVPDFVFHGWPEVGIDDFDATCAAVADAGKTAPTHPKKLGWIGNVNTNPRRRLFVEVAKRFPTLIDARPFDTWSSTPGQIKEKAPGQMTMAQMAKEWGILFDIEGAGYSGRLKMLLHSGRPVVVQLRLLFEYWCPHLLPMVNYVPVRWDSADVPAACVWIASKPKEAAAIGRNGAAFAKMFLTRDEAVKQWARTLAQHAQPKTMHHNHIPPNTTPALTHDVKTQRPSTSNVSVAIPISANVNGNDADAKSKFGLVGDLMCDWNNEYLNEFLGFNKHGRWEFGQNQCYHDCLYLNDAVGIREQGTGVWHVTATASKAPEKENEENEENAMRLLRVFLNQTEVPWTPLAASGQNKNTEIQTGHFLAKTGDFIRFLPPLDANTKPNKLHTLSCTLHFAFSRSTN